MALLNWLLISKAINKENCAIPENIHTPPTEGIGIPGMKLNWNFQRGRRVLEKNPFCGGCMDILILDLHIVSPFTATNAV